MGCCSNNHLQKWKSIWAMGGGWHEQTLKADRGVSPQRASDFLERSQCSRTERGTKMEMRKMLLETGGKAVLVIQGQSSWLECVPVLVFRGRSNVQVMESHEAISRPSAAGVAWLFLTAYSKMLDMEIVKQKRSRPSTFGKFSAYS